MLVALDTIAPGKVPGLRVSADPVQPREAIDWFGKKTPLDKAAWESLSEEARKRAFTAAWVTDVNVLQSVKDSLRQAIESGESFESWKKRVRSELGAKWDRSNSYLETVFRNNVQSAYAAGRYKAQTTPLIRRLRPYGRLVVLLDGRTSDICLALAKPPVVLPIDDPWWATHWPPLHHRCRSTVTSMSRRQAERAGILKAAPRVGAQDGWGSTAGLGEWQPGGEGIDPALFKPAEQAAAKALPKAEPAVEPPAKVVPSVEAPKAEPEPEPKAADEPKAEAKPPQRAPESWPDPAEEARRAEQQEADRRAREAAERRAAEERARAEREMARRAEAEASTVPAWTKATAGKRRFPVDREITAASKKVFAGKAPSFDALEQAWSGGGVNASVAGVIWDDALQTLQVNASLTVNGEFVGRMTRSFRRKNGKLTVYHDYLVLNQAAQGRGYGAAALKNSILLYKGLGASEIGLDAHWVGRYTWARFGFGWDAYTAEQIRPRLVEHLIGAGVSRAEAEAMAAATYRCAGAVASLEYDGRPVGKEFLLGDALSNWRGSLRLDDPKDPGYLRAKERLGL
ncbi:phage minor head protein [Sorangium sp. So ce1024]|uniref:phage head morphogenesis protein n=1 Tax=Sorangium sp. So ce1024 TaxID=3133327 RepID=UPI003F052028